MQTRVIQSYRTSDVPQWIETCLVSVKSWSVRNDFSYQFVGDEIFERVPAWYRRKTSENRQIATDLARLHLIQEAFDDGYDRAVWLDADVLVFNPAYFTVEQSSGFAFGREIWVQSDVRGRPRAFRNVHNAYTVFCKDNRFLSFYQYACEQIISRLEPGPDKGMAPQVVGPKLLTSLHNVLGFQLTDDIAMLSPDVLLDIVSGGGPSLNLLRDSQVGQPYGANLCASLTSLAGDDDGSFMERICRILLNSPEMLVTSKAPSHQDGNRSTR